MEAHRKPWVPPPGKYSRINTSQTIERSPKVKMHRKSVSEGTLISPKPYVDSVVSYRTDDNSIAKMYYVTFPAKHFDATNNLKGMLSAASDADKLKVQLQKLQKDFMVQCQKNDALGSINNQLQKELTHRDQQLQYIQSHSKQLEDKLVKQSADMNMMEQRFSEWTRRKEDEVNKKFGVFRFKCDRKEVASEIGDGIMKKGLHEDMKTSYKDQVLESNDIKYELSRLMEYKKEAEHYKQLYKETQTRLESYREKFHNAQQLVNEQKVQMAALMEEQTRLQEEAAREVEKFKNRLQMNGQLSELSPLREVLRVAMMKLQEAHEHKQQLESKLEQYQANQSEWDLKLKAGESALTDITKTNRNLEEKVRELTCLNNEYQNDLRQSEIYIRQLNEKVDEKVREMICLTRQLEHVRDNKISEESRSLEYYQQLEKNYVRRIQELEDSVLQLKTENAVLKGRQDEKEKAACSREKGLKEQVDYLQNTNDVLQNYLQLLKRSYTSVFNCSSSKNTYEALMVEIDALTSSVSSSNGSGSNFKRLK